MATIAADPPGDESDTPHAVHIDVVRRLKSMITHT